MAVGGAGCAAGGGGPGGSGKTRLALQLAADLAADYPHGTAAITFAAVETAEAALTALAAVLAVPTQGERPLADRLIEQLRPRTRLLLLDNLEHLLAGEFVALIGAIVRECPGVRVLATSRERLRLRDEWVWDLAGLALPEGEPGSDDAPTEAMDRFLERVRRLTTWVERFLGDPALPPQLHARLLTSQSLLIAQLGAWAQARQAAEAALAIQRTLGDPAGLAEALIALGGAEHDEGLLDAARGHVGEALGLYRITNPLVRLRFGCAKPQPHYKYNWIIFAQWRGLWASPCQM